LHSSRSVVAAEYSQTPTLPDDGGTPWTGASERGSRSAAHPMTGNLATYLRLLERLADRIDAAYRESRRARCPCDQVRPAAHHSSL